MGSSLDTVLLLLLILGASIHTRRTLAVQPGACLPPVSVTRVSPSSVMCDHEECTQGAWADLEGVGWLQTLWVVGRRQSRSEVEKYPIMKDVMKELFSHLCRVAFVILGYVVATTPHCLCFPLGQLTLF